MTSRRVLSCDEVREFAPLYVVGALSPDEEAGVREHLLTCPELHDEVAEFGGAAQALLLAAQPVEPPAALRDRLMAAAAADLVEGRHPSRATTVTIDAAPHAAAAIAAERAEAETLGGVGGAVTATEPGTATEPIVLAARRQVRWLRVALALAAALILALGGLGVGMARDLQAAQAYRDGVSAALALAAQPGSQAALLAADDGSISGLGVVGSDGTVRIAMRGLPATTGSQVYTAWSISGGSAPVPIGEFTAGSDGTAVATAHAPAATPGLVLAVTLEAHAGATVPTLPIVAKGVGRPPSG